MAWETREVSEARLLHNKQVDRSELKDLRALKQQAKDIQRAIFKWEARISERRVAERDAEARAEINLRSAIDRIRRVDNLLIDKQHATVETLIDVKA